MGAFTAWLRSPAENVVVLESGRPARTASTVNPILTAVFGFYEFHARHGVQVARALVDERRMGRGSFKPFLHGIAPTRPRGRAGRLRQERRLPQTLSVEQVAAVLAAQSRLRDRFLFALLAGAGMRIGQALGLRHRDLVSHERRVEIVAREDNANGARGKRSEGWVPITSELVRLHSDYMHEEYRDLDSDYVFVNLWAGRGRARDDLSRGRRGRAPHPPPGRFSLHRPSVAPHLRDDGVARRGAGGDRQQAVVPPLGADDQRHLPARVAGGPARRARARGRAAATRTALVILIETGLRSVDCLRLPFDPVTTDEAGAPCLRFWRGGWPTAVSATPRANQ